jgi:hypothetical protein
MLKNWNMSNDHLSPHTEARRDILIEFSVASMPHFVSLGFSEIAPFINDIISLPLQFFSGGLNTHVPSVYIINDRFFFLSDISTPLLICSILWQCIQGLEYVRGELPTLLTVKSIPA